MGHFQVLVQLLQKDHMHEISVRNRCGVVVLPVDVGGKAGIRG